MGEFFPEIKSQQQLVTNVIREEEASFLRTLEQGLQLLDKVVAGNIWKKFQEKILNCTILLVSQKT